MISPLSFSPLSFHFSLTLSLPLSLSFSLSHSLPLSLSLSLSHSLPLSLSFSLSLTLSLTLSLPLSFSPSLSLSLSLTLSLSLSLSLYFTVSFYVPSPHPSPRPLLPLSCPFLFTTSLHDLPSLLFFSPFPFVSLSLSHTFFSCLSLYVPYPHPHPQQAHLRSVDVRILQQLLAVHEGIEAVKWLLEERSTLTSRCSSLTSSQYSLVDGPEAPSSWRGSWGSLHDPHDRLDNISIGSYLDTLADDMDEYGCPSSSESVLCSAPAPASAPDTAPPPPQSTTTRSGAGTGGPGGNPSSGHGSPVVRQPEALKEDVWTRGTDATGTPKDKQTSNHTPPPKANGVLDKVLRPEGVCESARACLAEKLGKTQSPKAKAYQNGRVELDTCKLNGRMHLEYDAHWRWVQSQDDVTFL
ncbi:hypothetical protein ACEWY4_014901 [Coilia grayii]|uniref:Leucine rich adaptor protein 1 n=1 Tax=Coilia grayii TaxID=363190 RepID=A0ABD1JTZ0_9TELE